MLLKSLRLKHKYGPLKEGLEIEFSNSLTFITGDQGCGKSCLLRLLARRDKSVDSKYYLDLVPYENAQGMLYLYDSEHDNPRIDSGPVISGMDFDHTPLAIPELSLYSDC